MGWLRRSDSYSSQREVAALSDREYRTWNRLLEFCARNLDPSVDEAAGREVPGLSVPAVKRFAELGLVVEAEEPLFVIAPEHRQWDPLDPKNRERKRRQRDTNSHGDVTPDIARDMGVTRGVT